MEYLYTYKEKDTGKKLNSIWSLLDFLTSNCPCIIQRIDNKGNVESEQEYFICDVTPDGLTYHIQKRMDDRLIEGSVYLEKDADGNRILKPLNK